MPTTFNVIYLGNFANIDTVEGNDTAENAAALINQTIGGPGDALSARIQELSPGTRYPFDSDGDAVYTSDWAQGIEDEFRINGGPNQGFESTAVYNATITYADGTTATITAVVFQDNTGETYLAPEFAANADQAALEAGPLQSITLNSVAGDTFTGMTGDRQTGNFLPCYTPGALIATTKGLIAVEDLELGDKVITLDSGFQPVRWIGKATRRAEGALVPIRIKAGALGQGLPDRDLVVSPQHRMLLRSRIVERMMGCAEVLIPAKKLLGLPGIDYAHDYEDVTYIHFLCDRHEIIFAEGAPTETLLTGPQAMSALGPEGVAEIEALFPGVLETPPAPARPIPKGSVARKMLERHAKNDKPLLED